MICMSDNSCCSSSRPKSSSIIITIIVLLSFIVCGSPLLRGTTGFPGGSMLLENNDALQRQLKSCDFKLSGLITDGKAEPARMLQRWAEKVFQWVPLLYAGGNGGITLANSIKMAYGNNNDYNNNYIILNSIENDNNNDDKNNDSYGDKYNNDNNNNNNDNSNNDNNDCGNNNNDDNNNDNNNNDNNNNDNNNDDDNNNDNNNDDNNNNDNNNNDNNNNDNNNNDNYKNNGKMESHYSTDFIVATDDPESVLETVDEMFRNESHRCLAGLPHKTRWFVFVWNSLQLERVKAQQVYSVLDNVAVLKLRTGQKDRAPRLNSLTIHGLWTFVWTKHRTRISTMVDLLGPGSGNCEVFPNKRFGFNRRELKVAAAAYSPSHVDLVEDPLTGQMKFGGLFVDVLQYLSDWLNFTYVIAPSSVTNHSNRSWVEIEEMVSNGRVDIGLYPYTNSYNVLQNDFEVGYPFISDRVLAVYKKPTWSGSGFDYSKVISLSYMYVASGVFTSTLYVVIVFVIFPDRNEGNCKGTGNKRTDNNSLASQDVEQCTHSSNVLKTIQKNSSCIELKQIFQSDSVDTEQNQGTVRIKAVKNKKQLVNCDKKSNTSDTRRIFGFLKVTSIAYKYVSLVMIFLLAAINQAAFMPTPRVCSARFLVAFWGLVIVAVTSFFTSVYTASTVKTLEDAPFSTIEDLVASKEFTYVSFKYSTIHRVISNATSGLLAEINDHTKFVIPSDENSNKAAEILIKSLSENVAFIFYENHLKTWQAESMHAEDYVVINDELFEVFVGFIFAAGSEFTSITTPGIHAYVSTGLMKRNVVAGNQSTRHIGLSQSETSKRIYKHLIQAIIYTSLILIGVSVLLLLSETICFKLGERKRKGEIKHCVRADNIDDCIQPDNTETLGCLQTDNTEIKRRPQSDNIPVNRNRKMESVGVIENHLSGRVVGVVKRRNSPETIEVLLE